MKDDILTYREMCDREEIQTLQRGMNFRLHPTHSVILMSQRSNAPYNDEILADGITIIYEGHDTARTSSVTDPKQIDQPLTTSTGLLTQNGRFAEAVDRFRSEGRCEKVRVYEKLFSGVWSYRGLFDLIDYQFASDGRRKVIKFALILSNRDDSGDVQPSPQRNRVIPTEVKKLVWERDGGKCVLCGAKEDLHFDHEIPYSKGGSSIRVENVRILCAKHNLEKSDKIE